MNRLEKVRKIIDAVLLTQKDDEERRCGYVHLYGVASYCTMLSIKRKLDPELAATIGMLHDFSSYKTGDDTDHHVRSAEEARIVLNDTGDYSPEEIKIIAQAIFNHRDKKRTDSEYDELLKDADTIQHHLYNTAFDLDDARQKRVQKVFQELGL